MHRFTDRDISALKQELACVILQIYTKEFDFTPYLETKMITWYQRNLISAEIRTKYLDIKMDPVPVILQPLIPIARQRVAQNKEIPPPRTAPKYSYTWDDDLEYDRYYRRHRDDEYYY